MLRANLLTILGLAISLTSATRIEGVAASVDSIPAKKTENFIPLVAFECGYRNKFMGDDGNWVSDHDRYATCLNGKLDILKYCRKAYPHLDITNIVEYSHEVKINDWCKEEGSPCKWLFTVRPYQCIVGEFHSEALQVPHGCKFGHVSDQESCDTYKKWETEATKQCGTKTSLDGGKMTVRSFAILEPCGLDLFTGVEYVCCPAKKEVAPKVMDLDESKADEDEDDVDDDDVDYTDEDEGNEEDEKKQNAQDSYFQTTDPATEHERFKEAEQRLEKKYRKKFDKAKKEWSELETRYDKMEIDDPKAAQQKRNEMIVRREKTENALKEDYKEEKKQLEDTHDERVQANLNEKKRQATHDYRTALAVQVEKPNKHNVLKSLKAYIRAEEKDRTHQLRQYRRVLRNDPSEAETFKPVILHRLKYIDLRINSTLEMLRDFPDLQRAIRPIAVEFWKEYRGENTPLVTDEEYTAIGGEEQYKKLLDYYDDFYKRNHPEQQKTTVKSTTTTTTTTTQTPMVKGVKDSYEDLEEEDTLRDDDDVSASEKNNGVAVEKVERRLPEKKTKKDEETQTSNENSEDEDEDDDEDSDDKSEDKEIKVEIEPISNEVPNIHDIPALPAFAKHDILEHEKENPRSWTAARFISPGLLLIAFGVSGIALSLIITVTLRRRQHAGFIEVDVCTPEEKHVSGMQVNGYENPTYTFFDGKP